MIDDTYVELHAHTDASLGDAVSHPEVLVQRASALGMGSLGVTDHNNLYGAVRFAKAAKQYHIKPIFGSELTLDNGHHLTLLVQSETGWENLCQLITKAQFNAPKGEAALPSGLLEEHSAGLVALSGCRRGEIASALLRRDHTAALAAGQRYSHIFGKDRFYVELQHHLLPQDDALVDDLVALAQQLGLRCAATNNVHYATPDGRGLQDVLVCIRNKVPLDDAALLLRENSEYYLKTPAQMAGLFARYPDAVRNTAHIAEQCRFELEFGLQELPPFPTPDGISAHEYLRKLSYDGIRLRGIEPTDEVVRQLEHELAIVERSGLSNYLLIVWDIARFARDSGILYQARGSVVNSLIAYVLFISPINPLQHNLVFERFLSDERQAAADIDMDFAADHREEIIQYIYQKYGYECAAMACNHVTFQAASAVRDIGKALGLPPELLAKAAKALDTHQAGKLAESKGFQEVFGEQRGVLLRDTMLELCEQIDGCTNYLSIHNGGMVVMGARLSSRVPTEPARKKKRTVTQWDKDGLADAGLVKIDILGLRILAAIAEALRIIWQVYGVRVDFNSLSFDDPAVYEMICKGDTIGVFQVESRAQQQLVRRLKPRDFFALTLAISLIRPGLIIAEMVAPFMRRWLGLEEVRYPHPLLEGALEETLGVIVWQEQVLQVAHELAGFSKGQGELLRRALGAKRATDEIEKFHEAFITGAQAKGVPLETAEAVFNMLRAFGSYAFARSHAAAFAVIVYQSAWLKKYYPKEFTTALLNHEPLGFWPAEMVVNDAKRHGISVLLVDVNRSQGKCSIEGDAIRLGYNYVDGFGDTVIERVMKARKRGEFADIHHFCKRTRLSRRLIEHLITAGAMDSWGTPRPQLLWEINGATYDNELNLRFPKAKIDLPTQTPMETAAVENVVVGVRTGDHIMTYYRKWMVENGILGYRELEKCADGEQVRVAGQYKLRQSPPSAKGVSFLVLEDADGLIDAVVWKDVFARNRRVLRYGLGYPILIQGRVQRDGDVTSVLCEHAAFLQPVSDAITQ